MTCRAERGFDDILGKDGAYTVSESLRDRRRLGEVANRMKQKSGTKLGGLRMKSVLGASHLDFFVVCVELPIGWP